MGLYQLSRQLLILVFLASITQAQTRLYLTLTTRPATVAFNAGWNVTTSAARYVLGTDRDGTTIASRTSGASGAAAVRKCLVDQFVSQPLAAQTINGTLDGQIRFNQSSTSSTTGQGFVYVRLINTDNSVASEIGTMTTTNLTTTLTNRTLVQLASLNISVTAGQRIAIDVGWNYSVGTNTTRTGTASRGASAASDMSVDNTSTTANNPWVQFSQTLKWLPNSRHFF
jgi:hypothetical protein